MDRFLHPKDKLQKISSKKRQLWVVAYVDTSAESLIDGARADIDASFEGGADAVVLINEWCSYEQLDQTLAAVRRHYPRASLGVNYLGDPSEPYGFLGSFKIAQIYDLQIVWTDFSGVDRIEEREPIDLHTIEMARQAQNGERFFYCSGVHMKYSKLRDPGKAIEQSALQAMGWVDGVILTGAKTGVPCDPENLKKARAVLGNYPLGVASGVSPENVHSIQEWADFYLVASSLQDAKKRIVRARVESLRSALDSG